MKKDTNKYLGIGISLGLCFGACMGIIISIIMNRGNFIIYAIENHHIHRVNMAEKTCLMTYCGLAKK